MALSAERDTPKYAPSSTLRNYPVKGSTTIYKGGLVALSAGYLVPVSSTTGLIATGCADQTVVNSGADGAKTCDVFEGTFHWVNGDTIDQTDAGSPAYGSDDQTVFADGTGKSAVGIIQAIDSSGVWVESSLTISGVLS
jgi:hypothetical protein